MARDLEALADRLSVGQDKRLRWYICNWSDRYPGQGQIVSFFPDEDSAWGVVSLILQQVNEHSWPEDDAISWAMSVYKMCLNGIYGPNIIWTADLDDDSRRAQDHAAGMRVQA